MDKGDVECGRRRKKHGRPGQSCPCLVRAYLSLLSQVSSQVPPGPASDALAFIIVRRVVSTLPRGCQ